MSLILNEKNIAQFLKSIRMKRMRVCEILDVQSVCLYANNNYVWRLIARTDMGKKVLFVKQARAYNRRAWEQRGQKLSVDPKRMEGEYRMIQLLIALTGEGVIPSVYYYNRTAHILILSDVSQEKKLLIDEFEKERIHSELGNTFGKLFGTLHAETCGIQKDCCASREWRRQLISFFGKDHLGIGMAQYVPQKALDQFFQEAKQVTHTWIWGDPVYRNIFVGPGKHLSLIDFDLAFRYDPALDVGIFLSHWVWMGLKNKKLEIHSKKFIQDFIQQYEKEFKKKKLGEETYIIIQRAFRWMGLYLVSRTDGKSGSYFAKWPAWEKRIRQKGIELFLEK